MPLTSAERSHRLAGNDSESTASTAKLVPVRRAVCRRRSSPACDASVGREDHPPSLSSSVRLEPIPGRQLVVEMIADIEAAALRRRQSEGQVLRSVGGPRKGWDVN